MFCIARRWIIAKKNRRATLNRNCRGGRGLKILLALPAARFQDWGMIAAVTQKSAFQNFSLNWFDVALVLILAFGFWRGRKRGMSREFLPVSFWPVSYTHLTLPTIL